MAFVLALDQGTTSSRAIVFDETGAIRGVAQAEFRQIFPQPGWVEHDPEEIWRTQLDVARAAIANARISAREVAAIGIANQRETTVLWDRATGCAARQRDRLAGPPHRRRVRASGARGARAADRGENRARDRSLLLGDEAGVAPRSHPGRARSGGAGRARVRHDRYVARVEAHRRPVTRHRPVERLADLALRHRQRRLGRRTPRAFRRAARRAARGAALERACSERPTPGCSTSNSRSPA